MGQNQLENSDNFSSTITAANGTGIIEVLSCASYFEQYTDLSGTYHTGKTFFLEAFSGAAHLPSLAEAPFPELFPEMNSAERIAATIKIEEEFPYIGVKFYCKKGEGEWKELATTKIQNKGREITYPWTVPYLTINELKLFGASDRLGISIVNYGDGVLGVGDYINVKGDIRYIVDLVSKPTKSIGTALPYGIDIDSTSPTRFRAANPNRAIFYATNVGDVPIWMAGNNAVAVGSGIYLQAKGGTLSEQTLTGEFWAIAEGGTSRICGIEASYG